MSSGMGTKSVLSWFLKSHCVIVENPSDFPFGASCQTLSSPVDGFHERGGRGGNMNASSGLAGSSLVSTALASAPRGPGGVLIDAVCQFFHVSFTNSFCLQVCVLCTVHSSNPCSVLLLLVFCHSFVIKTTDSGLGATSGET